MAGGRSSSATAGTCSSGRTRSSWPTAFFARHGAATVFIGRLLPIVRTFISFPAGVARMPIRTFIVYSTAGAFIWSCLLVYAGTVLGANWKQIREALQPFDLLIAVVVVVAVAAVRLVADRDAGPAGPRRHRGTDLHAGAADERLTAGIAQRPGRSHDRRHDPPRQEPGLRRTSRRARPARGCLRARDSRGAHVRARRGRRRRREEPAARRARRSGRAAAVAGCSSGAASISVRAACPTPHSSRRFGALARSLDRASARPPSDRRPASSPGWCPILVRRPTSKARRTTGPIPSGSQARLFDAVLGTLGRISHDGAVVLAIEDLQWADGSTRDLIRFLVRNMTSERVAIVATYRTDDLHRRHPLMGLLSELGRIGGVERIELAAFDRAEVEEQLGGILGRSPEPIEVEAMLERSSGLPFYVEVLAAGRASGPSHPSRRCCETSSGRGWRRCRPMPSRSSGRHPSSAAGFPTNAWPPWSTCRPRRSRAACARRSRRTSSFPSRWSMDRPTRFDTPCCERPPTTSSCRPSGREPTLGSPITSTRSCGPAEATTSRSWPTWPSTPTTPTTCRGRCKAPSEPSMRSPPSMPTRRRSTTVGARSSCGPRVAAAEAMAGLDHAALLAETARLRVGDRALGSGPRDGARRARRARPGPGSRSPRRSPLRHVLVRVGGHPARAGHVPGGGGLCARSRRAAEPHEGGRDPDPRRRPMVPGPDHRIDEPQRGGDGGGGRDGRPPNVGPGGGRLCPLPRRQWRRRSRGRPR